jgi:hypothetical protein
MVGIIFPPIVEYEWTGNIIPTIIVIGGIMWVKQCHKPAMTGNGNHSTYIQKW